MTSLAKVYTMEKALVQIIFWLRNFICEQIFNFFVAFFKTFGLECKRMTMSCLLVNVLE